MERLTTAMDYLNINKLYGRPVVTLGPWEQKYSKHLETKIAYIRIPHAEDA